MIPSFYIKDEHIGPFRKICKNILENRFPMPNFLNANFFNNSKRVNSLSSYLWTSTLALLSCVIFLMVAPPLPMMAPTMSLETRIRRGKSTPRPGRRPFPPSSLPISPIDAPAIGFSISKQSSFVRLLIKIKGEVFLSIRWLREFGYSRRYPLSRQEL